jgi:hypothetical protein
VEGLETDQNLLRRFDRPLLVINRAVAIGVT